MKTILFIDEVCPKPYSQSTLDKPRQGGTESTVTRTALALEALKLFNVTVEQHNRQESEGIFKPLGVVVKADYVVCLRAPVSVVKARQRFPYAKIYLWSHDLASQALGHSLKMLVDAGLTANLVVSQFHKTQTVEILKPFGYTGQFRTQLVYNPIYNELRPDTTAVDKNKLAFVSSPHKGLEQTIELYKQLKAFNKDFTLHITNPGYFSDTVSQDAGIVNHGSLGHKEVVDLLRSSLCLFYPNIVFPETFGMVMAESNAVGTPVLTHAFGAAHEVCDLPTYEVIDCRSSKNVIERVMNWYNGGRPTVRGKAQFRLKNVIQTWLKEIFQ